MYYILKFKTFLWLMLKQQCIEGLKSTIKVIVNHEMQLIA